MTSRSRLIDDLLALRERATPGSTRALSFVDEGGNEEPLTYSDLAVRAYMACGALSALGVRENDFVLLALPGSSAHASLLLGCVLLGALPCTVPAPGKRFGTDSIETLLTACRLYGPRVLLTHEAAAAPLRHRLAELPTRVIDLAELALASAAGVPAPIALRTLDHPHHVQLTSGSVAHPRAAVLSHRAVLDNSRGIGGSVGYDAARDATVSWLPLHHDMGLITLLSNLHYQSRLQILQPASFVRNPLGWLKRIAAFGATTTAAPTFALRYCVRRFKADALQGVDLSCCRNIFVGAERVDEATVREFANTFAPFGLHGTTIQPCYGMAESTLAVTMQDASTTAPGPALAHVVAQPTPRGPGNAAEDRQLSVGRPIPGMAFKIVTEAGRLATDRCAGEIFIRGSSVMMGYLPAAGQEPPAPRAADAWLATGDIGYTVDGHLYILGRKKELIILRGTNYFPHEIEEIVAGHPAIHGDGCAAVGVFDPDQGTENLVILAETRPGHAPTPLRADMQSSLQRVLGHRAHEIVFVAPGTLPRTTSGKLQRIKSRAMYLDGSFRPAEEPPLDAPIAPPRPGEPALK